jgi:hypothetical protein
LSDGFLAHECNPREANFIFNRFAVSQLVNLFSLYFDSGSNERVGWHMAIYGTGVDKKVGFIRITVLREVPDGRRNMCEPIISPYTARAR